VITETAGVASALAHEVHAARVAQEARTAAKRALVDTLGVTLAGSLEPAANIVRRALATHAGACSVIGTPEHASATDAALINGTAAHALDFDDVSPPLTGHPSAVLVPALLAAAESSGAGGAAILDAFVVGFELAARLGRVMNPPHYTRGWHATGTLGAPAAAAAVSYLLRLDEAAMRSALAIAASLAGGMRASFGTMVKPLHAGHAARTGVLAAVLARDGFTGAEAIFETDRGFGELLGERPDWSALTADWDWQSPEILRTGIHVKAYPSCALTHTSIDALLSVRDVIGERRIERIESYVSPIVPQVLIHSRPTTGLEGKFSMQYCLAVSALDGQPGMHHFTDVHAARADVQALVTRVEMRVDEALPVELGSGHNPVRLRILMEHGETLVAHGRVPFGAPERPLSDSLLDEKFLSCARLVLDDEQATRALAALRDFEHVDHVGVLLALLHA
jgi:2-methylcitrate dehydratase PrpD